MPWGGGAGGNAWRAGLLGAAAVAYFLTAQIGLQLRSEADQFALFWPPNGLLTGLLLVARRGWWPGLAGAAAAAGLAANLLGGNPGAVSVGFTVVNVGEAVLLARLLGRLRGSPYPLAAAADVFLLYAGAGVVCALTAVAGAAVVVLGLGAEDYPTVWRAFWLSDAMGVMLVAPAVVGLAGAWPAVRAAGRRRATEAVVLAAAVVGLTALVFAVPGEPGGRVLALRLPVIPLLLWAALRFGPPAAAAVVLLLSLVLVWNAGHGRGLFANPGVPAAERLLTLQAFLFVVGVCALGLAAAAAGRRAALAALRESEERYRRVTEAIEEVFWVLSPAGGVEYASPGYARVWGRDPASAAVAGGPLADSVHPDDRRAAAAGPGELEYRIVRPDGAVRWVHTRTYPVPGRAGGPCA